MSTENPVEGNQQQPTGGAEPSTSSPSGSQQGQPLPEYVTTIMSKLEEQDKFLRGLQKGTDKQIGQVKNDIKRILELKEQGLNEQQIERELWIDAQIQGQSAPQIPAPDKGASFNGQDKTAAVFTAADAIAQAEEFGVNVNDQAFINLLRDKSLTKDKVRDFILDTKKPQKQSNPADFIQAPARGGTTGTEKDQIVSAYEKEIAQVPRGSAYTWQRAQVKTKYREMARKAGFNLNV